MLFGVWLLLQTVVLVYNVHRAKYIIPCSDKKRSVKMHGVAIDIDR